MDAIRQAADRDRVLESFWKGQIRSKTWLIDHLIPRVSDQCTVEICGGWNGVLASLLFQSTMHVSNIVNIDIDPACEPVSCKMNQLELQAGRYTHVVSDMRHWEYRADVIINTSCEHLSQCDYNEWIAKVPETSLVVLQSNDFCIDEHVRIAKTLQQFKEQSGIRVDAEFELSLPLYNRWMLIGKRI